MQITVHPNPDKGVTNLMYIGDDGLDRALGDTPWSERVPKIALAVGLLAALYFATQKRKR
jgi:hypothetical protein